MPRPLESPVAAILFQDDKLAQRLHLRLRRMLRAPMITTIIPAAQSKEDVAVTFRKDLSFL